MRRNRSQGALCVGPHRLRPGACAGPAEQERADRLAQSVNKYGDRLAEKLGYDSVTATVSKKGRKYAKVTITFSKTKTVVRHIPRSKLVRAGEGSAGQERSTSSESNGMRGRDVDTGDGGTDRF